MIFGEGRLGFHDVFPWADNSGQVLIRLMAPELSAQPAEAEAKLGANAITYNRLTTAAATPGVVAPNDFKIAK